MKNDNKCAPLEQICQIRRKINVQNDLKINLSHILKIFIRFLPLFMFFLQSHAKFWELTGLHAKT